ncbi:hypothetical protein TFLX_03151 [Thermoflexales bacterium]|nr:hypothetical protein TFLX_03151 [Thermoflexales bacterium]
MTIQLGSAYGKVELDTSGVKRSGESAVAALKQMESMAAQNALQWRGLGESLSHGASRGDVARAAMAGLDESLKRGDITAAHYEDVMGGVQTKFGLVTKSSQEAATRIQHINQRFADGEIDAKQYQVELDKIARSLRDVRVVGERMASIGGKLTLGVTLPIVGIGIAAVKAASDLSETQNKIDVLFGESTSAIKEWSSTSATALGQSRTMALNGAADFATFGKAAGLAGNDLVNFSKQNVQLAADFASFFNTSPEDAITAIGAAYRGESEPIRRYGVLLNDATVKAEALRLGLIKTTSDALTPQARVLAVNAVILKQTTAAQGDFARTADGVANQSRIMKAQFEDAAAALGENLLPLVKDGMTLLNGLLTAFRNLPPDVQKLIIIFGALAAAVGPVLVSGGQMIKTFIAIKGGVEKLGGLGAIFTKIGGAAAGAVIPLGLIVVGLTAVMKFLDATSRAAQATNDELIKMANSNTGDILEDTFNRAGAATEILTNGQERLKKALDGTHEKIKAGAKNYADYRSSIEATAKAAGYEIDAEGNLVKVLYGMGGVVRRVVQENYALSEAAYALTTNTKLQAQVQQAAAVVIDKLGLNTKRTTEITENAAAAYYGSRDGLRALAEAQRDANQWIADGTARMDDLKVVMAGALKNEMKSYGDKQDDLKTKAAALKDEIEKLTAANGRAITTTSKATLTDIERAAAEAKLAALQEDYTQKAKKKNETELEFQSRMAATAASIEDVQGKLDGATKSTTAYVDNSKKIGELKGQYDEINKEIREHAAAHEDATRRILFGYAEQRLAVGGLTEAEAVALDKLAVEWGLKSQADITAMQAIRDAAKDLAEDGNIDAFVENVVDAGEETLGALNETQEKLVDVAKTHGVMVGDVKTQGEEMSGSVKTQAEKAQESFGTMTRGFVTDGKTAATTTKTMATDVKGAVGDIQTYMDLVGPGIGTPLLTGTQNLSAGMIEEINKIIAKVSELIESLTGISVPDLSIPTPPGGGGGGGSGGDTGGGGGGGGGGNTCFAAGTLILLEDGVRQKPIEQITVGERVTAFDYERFEFLPGTVTELTRRTVGEYYRVRCVSGLTIEVTGEHPFYAPHQTNGHVQTVYGEFVRVRHLRSGHVLTGYDHDEVVKAIELVQEPLEVFNFNVTPCHTYIASGVIVHNVKISRATVLPRTVTVPAQQSVVAALRGTDIRRNEPQVIDARQQTVILQDSLMTKMFQEQQRREALREIERLM